MVGSRGNVCTGSMIAPTIVLTAGHCITPNTTYRVIDYTTQPPRLISAQKVVAHPQFNMQAMFAHRATADVALLQLAFASAGQVAPHARFAAHSDQRGRALHRRGIGATASTATARCRHVRAAALTVTGKPGTLQIRLVDPATRTPRGPRRLHRRFRRAGVRGSERRHRHRRRGELVDRRRTTRTAAAASPA